MLPSEKILESVPPSNPANSQYEPTIFERSLLNFIDSEYLKIHQGHTNAGLSCQECRDLDLVVTG